MSYVNPDYPTKRALRQAVKEGKELFPYNPSGLFPAKRNGRDVIEGPHYPAAHRWYAEVEVKDGVVVKVR